MTDQQLAPGAQAAPLTITLDTAQTLFPKLAFASFDGSGASGDFLPVIKFVGPGNIVAAQAVGDVVTAGESVDQTWFRGLATQAAAGGAGPVEYFHEVAGPHAANLTWTLLNWTHDSGASLLDLTVPTAPTFKTAGVYAVTACGRCQTSITWPGFLGLWLSFNSETEDHASITLADADSASGISFKVPQVTVTEIRTVTAGEVVKALTSHNQGGPVQINLTHAVVQQIA